MCLQGCVEPNREEESNLITLRCLSSGGSMCSLPDIEPEIKFPL